MSSENRVFGVIYSVTHVKEPDRVRYYGQTVGRVERRRQGHYDAVRAHEDRPIVRWLRKYYEAQEDVRFTVVKECYSREDLDQSEIDLISEGRRRGWCDLNVADGGSGTSGVPNTEKQKRKIRESLRGEGTWKHVLTWGDVREIRKRHLAGEAIKTIALDYPASSPTIGHVVRNKTWVDPKYIPREVKKYRTRVTPEEVRAFRDQAEGEEPKTLRYWASRWNVDSRTASRILRNDIHPDPDRGRIGTLDVSERLGALTWGDVREMRRQRARGWVSVEEMAKKYGVSPRTIRRALRNETYCDVSFDPKAIKRYGSDKMEE